MAKKIKNPVDLRAIVHFGPLHIEYVVVKYGVTCGEYDIEQRKGLPLLQTQEIKNCLKDFAEEAVRQIDIEEGIAEGDSLIEYKYIV